LRKYIGGNIYIYIGENGGKKAEQFGKRQEKD
jgi:hypothetical protein